MSRWIAYFGNPIRPRTLLYDIAHGLAEQSRRDRFAGGNPNADGYRNTLPAWGDRNLWSTAARFCSPSTRRCFPRSTEPPIRSCCSFSR
jgi:hypothetical protein